jgi:hypothetical protein
MRVYDRNITGGSAAEAGRSSETAKVSPAEHGLQKAAGNRSRDRVELSGTLERLSRALSASEGQRAQKVESLAAVYQAGKYSVPVEAVSHAMVAEALMMGE